MALTDKLSAIADAIRGKTGGTEKLTLAEMPLAIAGIEAGGGGGLAYDMGEFVLDADTVGISVPHSLGVAPEFICVWTDHWAGLTSENPVTYDDAKNTAAGFIWLKEITGMVYRAATAANGTPFCCGLQIIKGDYRVGSLLPTSNVYGMFEGYYTEATFSSPTFGANGPRYRAGVTYKYFVSKAWWNVGGVANAE
jgi:hypothetical protein